MGRGTSYTQPPSMGFKASAFRAFASIQAVWRNEGIVSAAQPWPRGAPNRLHRRFERGKRAPWPVSSSDD
eukprot:4894591-Lingulodinium_polyedra.AAC.1